jgi:hypothetical protein
MASVTGSAARGWLSATIAAAALSVGCGSSEPVPQFAPTDPAGSLFRPDHVVEVAIEIDPGGWEALRRQTRDWWDIAAAPSAKCMSQPFPKPFDWFPATITIDGERRESVAVRKKGLLGSLSDARPALKVRFDLTDLQLTFHGLKRLTLNNCVQDPTWLRQCLAYRVFAEAGIPVPWCNFAHLTVNGRDLGLYAHIESMDRRWVRRHFARDQGDLWEGEFSDFREDWLNTFELKGDVEDDDQTRVDRSRLAAVAAAVAPYITAAQIPIRLRGLIDFDEFVRLWAVEKILEHWDGYANNVNNFFVYDDPASGRLVFMPAGTDQITVPDPFDTTHPPVSVYATGVLSNRLYESTEGRLMYASKLTEMLDRAFHEQDLLAEIDRMQALITPVLARSGADLTAQAQAVESLRSWVRGRRAVLMENLRGGPPEWQQPLMASFCRNLVGSIEGTFATTFGTNMEPDSFLTGSGTITGTYWRTDLGIYRVGAQAGYDRNAQSAPWPVVTMTGLSNDGSSYDVSIAVNPEQFRDGTSGPFNSDHAWGSLGRWSPIARQWIFVGGFVSGRVELDQAGLAPGSPVTGRFTARVIRW